MHIKQNNKLRTYQLAYIAPLIKGAETAGLPLQKILESSHLNRYRLDDLNIHLPAHLVHGFMGKLKRTANNNTLAVQFKPFIQTHELGDYGNYLMNRPNFLQVISESIRTLPTLLTGNTMGCQFSGTKGYFYIGFPKSQNVQGKIETEQLSYAMISSAFQLAGGPKWKPLALHFPDASIDALLPLFPSGDYPIYKSKHYFVLTFDIDLLSKKMNRPKKKMGKVKLVQKPPLVKDTILKCIQNHTMGNMPKLNTISSDFGVSKRSINRFLAAENTSFKQLLSQHKMLKSIELLKNTNLKVYQIAEALSFEETTNFTRFFKSRFGITPSVYQKIIGAK